MVTYNEVISWLEEKLKVKDVRLKLGFQSEVTDANIKWYRGLEYSDEFKKDIQVAQSRGVTFHIDPALPVDVVMVAKIKEREEEDTGKLKEFNYYWVFWVILSEDPGLKKRLLFYQFYLSRVSEPYRVKMIIVTAADGPKNLMGKLREIAEENKFGLWIADVAKDELTQVLEAKTFRDRMVEEFREPINREVKAKFPEEIRNRAKDLAMFFDSYVRDAVEAIVGITPEEAGKRYIDRKILDLAFKLEKVSYGQKVQELVTEHLSKKTNDYKFVTGAFDSLWKECQFEIPYSDFLETFEPALYHLSAGGGRTYRDHYLHQFQVFLLGLHIIDKFHDRNTTSLTVSKSPMYTTRIVTSNLEISHSNFVYLSYRMADISLWPIRAIHMWAKYHMRVEGPPIPKIFENIEMRIEAVQTVVYGHTIGKLEKQHRKKKSKKNALGIAYDGSVGVPPPPSRDDPDRIFRTDGVTHLRIHESEMQQVGKVMFRGPVHIDEVPYYSVLIVDGTASYITVRPEDIAEHITSMYFTDGTVRCGLIQYTPENCSNVKTKIRGVHAQQRINENFDPLIMRTEDSPGEERTLGTNHPASPRTLGTNHPASPWSTTLTRPLYVTQAGLAGLANSTPEATYGSASVAAEETVDVQEFGSVGVGVPTRNPRNYGEHYRRMTEHSRVGDGERHSGRHWDSPALSEEMQRVERELREQRIADAIAQEEDSEELNVEQE